MKRVLIPLDGSATSTRAVAYFIDSRAQYKIPEPIEVHLLNVRQPVSGDVSTFVSGGEIKQYHYDQGIVDLQAGRELLDQAGIPYSFHVSVGDVAEVIAQYAKRLNCDHIVMGAHGRDDIAAFLLGSVTKDVIRLGTIPVTVVK